MLSTSLQLDYILSISRESETISICVTRSDSSVDATVDLEYDALALHSELGFKESLRRWGLVAYGVIVGVRWSNLVRNCNAAVSVVTVSMPHREFMIYGV